MIIDSHVHLPAASENTGTNLLLKRMDQSKIDQAILIPSFNEKLDSYISLYCEKYPKRFMAFLGVNFKSTDYITSLNKKYKNKLGKGLKIHPQKQKIKLDDSKVIEVIKLTERYHLPLMIDFFPQQTPYFPINYTYPENLISIINIIPDTKIIIAHAGGFKLWEAFFLARAYPNIYLEFSFSMNYFIDTSLANDMIFVLKKLGAKKCIFGSDYPEVTFKESINRALFLTDKAGYTPEDKNYFFSKTILSII